MASKVQERALKVVPDLCETIDYAEVQGVMFPRVALVFTKTHILSVKVATLVTFLSMVKTLDQVRSLDMVATLGYINAACRQV
jgi:SCY1-like protein 2